MTVILVEFHTAKKIKASGVVQFLVMLWEHSKRISK